MASLVLVLVDWIALSCYSVNCPEVALIMGDVNFGLSKAN